MKINPKNIKLYINMDMISRSVIEDTARRQLSIGTRTLDENLRELARKTNTSINPPFVLDLWDVTGHSGSDYASFTARNIPVMTYNTGLHNDYHTPRDISATADLVKMGDVLKLVNESLQEVLENIK
jgi:Zn-dependent M28 family amino/carboxypeptidase